MSYTRRAQQPALGWIQAIPLAVDAFQSVSKLFSGGGLSLADRITQRIAWTLQAAKMGSELAAAIVLGGSHEQTVDASERAGWSAVLPQVPASVLAAARSNYPNGYWPVGQPDFYTDTNGITHTTIVREVNQAAAQEPEEFTGGANLSFPSSSGAQVLPAVHTTAQFNWIPYAIVGGVALFVLPGLLNRKRGR